MTKLFPVRVPDGSIGRALVYRQNQNRPAGRRVVGPYQTEETFLEDANHTTIDNDLLVRHTVLAELGAMLDLGDEPR